jgi:class 3 adenylate cyclase
MEGHIMDANEEIKKLRAALKTAEKTQAKLDRTVFNLRTLQDISTDIYSSIETESIMHNFLLMCMGSFGSKRGFLMLINQSNGKIDRETALGYMEEEWGPLRKLGEIIAGRGGHDTRILPIKKMDIKGPIPMKVRLAGIFFFEPHWQGVLMLDDKLVGSEYSAEDLEMLQTLINSLIISLKNAKFYEEVWALNQALDAKNIELSKTLQELQASMRKIELLESIKDSLNKFVPHAVTRAIEKSPFGHMPESRSQDLSVLFLDIEGYTRLCEKLGSSEVNSVIEKHFSVFMDAIHANNGDVNETAGDGLMVLFLNEDKTTNALNAVSTAQTIQEEAACISAEIASLYKPLEINIGINSGRALVGAARFDSLAGSRWTYTARGSLINVAARIGAMAKGGQTFLSKATAERVMRQMDLKAVGNFSFKNVQDKVAVYQLL